MILKVALLIHLLLVVDRADSTKGECPFVILMVQSLKLMRVLCLTRGECWT